MSDAYDVYLRLPSQIWLYPRGQKNEKGGFQVDSDTRRGKYKLKRLDISENGVFQVLEGVPYPRKGYTDTRTLRAVGAVKSTALLLARIIYAFPILLPFVWVFRKKILYLFARHSHKVLRTYYWKNMFYLPSTKEIFRALGDIDFDLAMFFVMVWEFDDYYRFTGQRFLSYLNKDAFLFHSREFSFLSRLKRALLIRYFWRKRPPYWRIGELIKDYRHWVFWGEYINPRHTEWGTPLSPRKELKRVCDLMSKKTRN